MRFAQMFTQVIAERHTNVHHGDGRKRSAVNVSSHEEQCRQGVMIAARRSPVVQDVAWLSLAGARCVTALPHGRF